MKKCLRHIRQIILYIYILRVRFLVSNIARNIGTTHLLFNNTS